MINYPEKNNVKDILIDVELIYEQKYIVNRHMKNKTFSYELLAMAKSIREIGLIHPILVRADNVGRYELFVGNRRFQAYKMLLAGEPEKYKYIDARVYPNTTSIKRMSLKNKHENYSRKDPKPSEKIESDISLLPIVLEVEAAESNNGTQNFILGFEILKKFDSYIRTKSNKEKYEKLLQEITGQRNIIKNLYDFFDQIGVSPKSFFLSAKVYFTCKNNIIRLFREGMVTNRHAMALQSMRSEEDKKKIILRLEKGEKIGYKLLEKVIRESNAKFSPIKKNNKIIQMGEHIIIKLRRDKGSMSDQQYDEIMMYYEKMENVIDR